MKNIAMYIKSITGVLSVFKIASIVFVLLAMVGVLIGIAGILTIGAHLAAATQLALYEPDEEDENEARSK